MTHCLGDLRAVEAGISDVVLELMAHAVRGDLTAYVPSWKDLGSGACDRFPVSIDGSYERLGRYLGPNGKQLCKTGCDAGAGGDDYASERLSRILAQLGADDNQL